MVKNKEIVYMILDELKVHSDDSYFNENHILFLCKNYRNLVLQETYKFNTRGGSANERPSETNYQEVCLDLEEEDNDFCEGRYLKSIQKLPKVSALSSTTIYPQNYYPNTNIVFRSKEEMRWAGINPTLKNFIYASIGPNNYLYLKSCNPQFKYLKKLKLMAIFEDFTEASKISCEADCDIMEMDFPLESDLIPRLIQLVVQELLNPVHSYPVDDTNNAKDDKSNQQTQPSQQ